MVEGRMEKWKSGKMEWWNDGKMEYWRDGKFGVWSLELFKKLNYDKRDCFFEDASGNELVFVIGLGFSRFIGYRYFYINISSDLYQGRHG